DLRTHEGFEIGTDLAEAHGIPRDAGGGEFVMRQIEAAAEGVFFQIAKDVGELERGAAVDGEIDCFVATGETPDVDAGDADGAGDAVAVLLEGGEVLERGRLKVLALAFDGVVEQMVRNAAAMNHVGECG